MSKIICKWCNKEIGETPAVWEGENKRYRCYHFKCWQEKEAAEKRNREDPDLGCV